MARTNGGGRRLAAPFFIRFPNRDSNVVVIIVICGDAAQSVARTSSDAPRRHHVGVTIAGRRKTQRSY